MNRTGEYEHELDSDCALQVVEPLTMRLLSAMNYGVFITHSDGHRWIHILQPGDGISLDEALRVIDKPIIRSKCYGNVMAALDRIDGALKVLDWPSLQVAFRNASTYKAWG